MISWILVGVTVVLIVLALVLPDTIDVFTRILWTIVTAPFKLGMAALRRLNASRAWSKTASRFELKRQRWDAPGAGILKGEYKGLHVNVTPTKMEVHGEERLHTRVQIDGLPVTLSLRPRNGGKGAEITGIPETDDAFIFEGPTVEWIATLTHERRGDLEALFNAGAFRISKGTLHLLMPYSFRLARQLPVILAHALDLATALSEPGERGHQMQETMLKDEPWHYRRRVWQTLLEHQLLDLPWFSYRLDAANPDVRPLIAAVVSEQMEEHLLEVAAQPTAPLPLRLMVLDTIEARTTADARLVEAALIGPVSVTRRVVSLLVREHVPVPVARVGETILDVPADVALILLRWVGTSSDAEVPAVVLHALSHDEEVQIAACEILTLVAGRKALAPLVSTRDNASPRLREAAIRAINAIRSRVGGEVGSLSVVDDRVGAVEIRRED